MSNLNNVTSSAESHNLIIPLLCIIKNPGLWIMGAQEYCVLSLDQIEGTVSTSIVLPPSHIYEGRMIARQ
jgi:hypothetical protein